MHRFVRACSGSTMTSLDNSICSWFRLHGTKKACTTRRSSIDLWNNYWFLVCGLWFLGKKQELRTRNQKPETRNQKLKTRNQTPPMDIESKEIKLDGSGVVSFRPAVKEDEAFLLDVYGSTRLDELALTNWDQTQKDAFVRMQFTAQQRHYSQQSPTAE